MTIPLTARGPVDFRPPALEENKKLKDVVIKVRVPTFIERDSYSAALIRGGVVSYTPRQIRDITLAGVEHLFNENEIEDVQTLLEELWADLDERRRVELEQQQRLLELHEEAKAKKKTVDPKKAKAELEKIKPSVVMDRQRFVRANSISQRIMARYEPLQEALSQLTDQDARRSWLNAEIYVCGWEGLPHEPVGNDRGGLTKEETEYLRSQIGKDAFLELSDFITALQGLDEDEEKNLASLLENMSVPIGSTQPKSSASSEDGNSTDESTTSTPESTTSGKTTESSSGSSTSSRTKSGGSGKSGRTAKGSSTSQ